MDICQRQCLACHLNNGQCMPHDLNNTDVLNGSGMEAAIGADLADIFAASKLHWHTQQLIAAESEPVHGSEPLGFRTQYARSSLDQVRAGCCWMFVPMAQTYKASIYACNQFAMPRAGAEGKMHLIRCLVGSKPVT